MAEMNLDDSTILEGLKVYQKINKNGRKFNQIETMMMLS